MSPRPRSDRRRTKTELEQLRTDAWTRRVRREIDHLVRTGKISSESDYENFVVGRVRGRGHAGPKHVEGASE